MMSKGKPLLKIGCIVLVTVISLVFFHQVYLEKVLNTFEVTVDLTAQGDDTLALYSADNKGRFSGKRSVHVPYITGQQSVKLSVVLRNAKMPLRFDPGSKTNSIVVHGVSFARFGGVESLTAQQMKSYIIENVGARSALTAEGLDITFNNGDPQLFLQGFPLPAAGFLKVYAYFSVLFVVCLLVSVFMHRSSPGMSKHYLVKGGSAALFVGIGGYYLGWSFSLALLLFLVILYNIIKIVANVSKHKFDGIKSVPFSSLIVIACFVLLLMWPFIRAVSPGSTFISKTRSSIIAALEDKDKRISSRQIRTLIHTFEDSFFSNFPYRKELINLNATIKIFYLGFTPTSKAILGKEGMFFEGYGQRRVESDVIGSFDNITDYMGLIPFTEKELEEWLLCLEERYYWMKELGIDYVFALAPTKALIYPENLPPRILKLKTKLNQATRFEQLVNYLKEKSIVPVVDLRTELLKAKGNMAKKGISEDTLFYYKTDFHWNYLGSFLAYQAIVEEINRSYPKYQFTASQLDEFTIHKRTDWVHYRFINALGLDPEKHQNETYLTFYPEPDSIYTKIGEYGEKGISDYSTPEYITKSFGGKKVRLRELENDTAKTPLIFVMGDSFSGKFFGFFSKHAKKTIRFRTVYSFVPEIYAEALPDIVIQEILNMYLLEKPPKNPASIKGARIRALTGLKGSNVSATN